MDEDSSTKKDAVRIVFFPSDGEQKEFIWDEDAIDERFGKAFILCPYHEEKTASCLLYQKQEKNEDMAPFLFFCFGCQKQGTFAFKASLI